MHANNLFSRLIVLVERQPDVAQCFAYELTPQPSSLFKDSMMRKPDKASLGRLLCKESIIDVPNTSTVYVLDGGSLLHRVKWPKEMTYIELIGLYLRYVKSNFGSQVTVVFDGYDNGPSTKDHEHDRRANFNCAPQILVSEAHTIHSNQSAFLSNNVNKSQFITLLGQHLMSDGHRIIQSVADADTDIVQAAIRLATDTSVTVVAGDTDIIIL